MPRSPSRAPTRSTVSPWIRRMPATASWHRARATRISARRCANLGSPRRSPPRSGFGSTRSACPGRWSRKACASSPSASRKSSSSKSAARSSRTRSSRSCSTGATTSARASSARWTTTTSVFSLSPPNSASPRSPVRSPSGCFDLISTPRSPRCCAPRPTGSTAGRRARCRRSPRSPARRISARAARTTPRPRCPKAAAPLPASAVISWRCGWTARPRPTPTWEARACRGSAWRRSPRKSTCSPISATAPTSIPAASRSARRSRQAPTSPTRCSTTMRPR